MGENESVAVRLVRLLVEHDANDPDVLARKIEALYAGEIAHMQSELDYLVRG